MVHHMQLHQLPQASHQNPYTNTITTNSQQEQVPFLSPSVEEKYFTKINLKIIVFLLRVRDCEPLLQRQLVAQTARVQAAARRGRGELKR